MKPISRTFFAFFLLIGLIGLSCSVTPSARPLPTFVPATPYAGWAKYVGGEVELWMPAHYIGGDPDTIMPLIIQQGRTLGPEYQKLVDMVEEGSSAMVLWVFDNSIGPSGFVTNVNVGKESVSSSITLEKYLDSIAAQVGPLGFEIIEQGIVQLDNYQAGRVVVQSDLLHAREVVYLMKVNSTMWVTTYAAGISEFSTRLKVFDMSANTIKIRP